MLCPTRTVYVPCAFLRGGGMIRRWFARGGDGPTDVLRDTEEFSAAGDWYRRYRENQRVLVIHPNTLRGEDALRVPYLVDEAKRLVHALRWTVLDTEVVPMRHRFLGKGKVASIAQRVKEKNPDVVLVNGSLSTLQLHTLEDVWKPAKVLCGS
eukprot:TRINITY_DN36941_c0_g1_i1.p1 TRINITY_DN36941_c0_g1~~TRINITY_DN36941_c0_g1_i1.p1  ORF type:complete len:153 (-),score=26.41 TRINITY_DN36941_c0_g1_i1:11-469(-)